MSEIYREGTLANGQPYSVLGRAHNGDGAAVAVDEHISRAGQDAMLVLPEHNVVGVFDGAGGTSDIGSPEQAALTAADAVAIYFKKNGNKLAGAMEYARQAVIHDPRAGLCVGALARTRGRSVEVVNAGDAVVYAYSPMTKTLDVIGEQQMMNGEPSNYLGRQTTRIPKPISDKVSSYRVKESGTELYVMSDGAGGSWQAGTDLEEYHFMAAHDDYLLLRAAAAAYPDLEKIIRTELRGQKAQALKQRQIDETTNGYGEGGTFSPELEDSSLFSMNGGFDWAIWDEIVKPQIEKRHQLVLDLSARAISTTLIERPIRWPHEKQWIDDASIVRVELGD